MEDKQIKKIEQKMLELYKLISKADLWGWTKVFRVGELEKDKGIVIDFHSAEFSEKCLSCKQPIIKDGLIDLYDIEKTLKKNREGKMKIETRRGN